MASEQLYYTPEKRAHDPREHQDWFLHLPEHGKEEMRRLWMASESAVAETRERRTKTTNRYLIEGVVFFLAVFLLFHPLRGVGLLLAASMGFAVGCANAFLRSGTYRYGWVSAAGYAVFGLLYMGWLSIFPFIFSTCGGAMLGVAHTLNRSDLSES